MIGLFFIGVIFMIFCLDKHDKRVIQSQLDKDNIKIKHKTKKYYDSNRIDNVSLYRIYFSWYTNDFSFGVN